MLPTDGQSEQTHPTCGVIVEKNDEVERICGLPGSQVVFMVDPESRSQVTAVLVVCDRHDQALENGEKLIFLSEDLTIAHDLTYLDPLCMSVLHP